MANNIERVSLNVPGDLIFDFLLRLPVKTLIRFKSVCKTWYALIKSPNFVETHKKLQPSIGLEPTYDNMIVTTKGPGNTKKCSLLHYSEASNMLINSELSFLPSMENCVVVGVCNGLVCVRLSSNSTELVVCNPTTRQFRQTPTFKLPKIEDDLIFLGFCSHVNGYEIIRIIFTPSNDIYDIHHVIHAELYTMWTDTWTEIEFKLGESYCFEDLVLHGWGYREAVVICGVFYWTAGDYDGFLYVVSFDKCKDVLDIIAPLWVAYDAKSLQLHEITGKLGLIIYRKHNRIELYVQNEGMDWSMIQKFDFSDIPCYPVDNDAGCSFKVLWKAELVLFRWCAGNSKLLMYDLNGQEIKCLRNVDFDGVVDDTYLYTVSLTPVN